MKLSGTSKPSPLQESNLSREEARVGRRLPCGPHRPLGRGGRVPRWISAPANRGFYTGSGGASKPVYRMFPHTAHQQLLVVFRVLGHQQVLRLTWRAMFTLCSGAALSVLYWMTLRCLQQSESLSFLKRGLPAMASCGALQRGMLENCFTHFTRKNNRKTTIILMPPRNAYYSWTTKVLSLPKALPPFSIFQQQCRDLGTGSKMDS